MEIPGRLVLLGHPVGHSLSPTMHNAALQAAGIDLRYEALDVEPSAFERTLVELRGQRAAGNVTVPHKERMYAACHTVTNLARRVGAVNVFWTDPQGDLVGDNSDVGGVHRAVATLLRREPGDLTVGVIGAGGAAAAVLAAVETWPRCHAHVFNRTPERARLLCERFSTVAQPVDDIGVIAGAQLIVNATSIGLRDGAMPLDPALVPADSAVIDLVYRPGETHFVRALRGRGVVAADGLGMLVEQGALAFETWFGMTPDRAAMWEALVRR
ncbi:MAG: shikimate dehydrogenase [bacterium]